MMQLEHHLKLMRAVRAWNNPVTLEAYLEALAEVLRFTGLEDDDPRLVTSTPKALRGWFLPVTINNRYVLAARNRSEQDFVLILEAGFVQQERLECSVSWHFRPLFQERLEPPYLCGFADLNVLDKPELKQSWLEASRTEVNRARKSVFRQHHNAAVHRAATDLEYRQAVFNEAQHNMEVF
jgi:hypothetical protein